MTQAGRELSWNELFSRAPPKLTTSWTGSAGNGRCILWLFNSPKHSFSSYCLLSRFIVLIVSTQISICSLETNFIMIFCTGEGLRQLNSQKYDPFSKAVRFHFHFRVKVDLPELDDGAI